MTIFLVTTAVLVLLAFFIKGNPDLIIKSYMSEEERAGLDMKGLGRLWFYGLILVAVISGGGGLALYLAKLHTFSKGFLFAVIVCGIFVLYLKTRKYCPPSMSRRFNVGIGIFGAVIVGAVFFMVVSAGGSIITLNRSGT